METRVIRVSGTGYPKKLTSCRHVVSPQKTKHDGLKEGPQPNLRHFPSLTWRTSQTNESGHQAWSVSIVHNPPPPKRNEATTKKPEPFHVLSIAIAQTNPSTKMCEIRSTKCAFLKALWEPCLGSPSPAGHFTLGRRATARMLARLRERSPPLKAVPTGLLVHVTDCECSPLFGDTTVLLKQK